MIVKAWGALAVNHFEILLLIRLHTETKKTGTSGHFNLPGQIKISDTEKKT